MQKISLLSNTIDIELEGKDKKVETLQLREMTAANRDKYLNALAERMHGEGEGRHVRNFDGMHADLLCLCLFRKDKPVGREEIQGWPAKATQALFDAAQELNGLGKLEEKDQAKKA